MPIPHQFIFLPTCSGGGGGGDEVPMETYPFDETDKTSTVNHPNGNAPAQLHRLDTTAITHPINLVGNCWLRFNVVSSLVGLRYRVAIYHETTTGNGELIALSVPKDIVGGVTGECWVVLGVEVSPHGQILPDEKYYVALFLDANVDNRGFLELSAKDNTSQQWGDLTSQYITAPSLNSDSNHGDFATIQFGSWRYNDLLWFRLDPDGTTERLP